MRTRKLALKREALTALSTDEMASVAGGSHTCAVTDACTHTGSIDAPCPTIPPTQCTVVITLTTALSIAAAVC